MKQYPRLKARLFSSGNLVDIINHSTYYFKFKVISVNIPHVISHRKILDQSFGNISNASANAYSNGTVHAISVK